MALLTIDGLCVAYPDRGMMVRAVDDVSLRIEPGEIVAVVGESGCGKSSLALAIGRLIQPPGVITGGRVVFRGKDVLTSAADELRAIRGGQIGYVFQDPATSLNPVMTVGAQLREAIALHTAHRGSAADAYAVELLSRVGIPAPAERLSAYPHELSGGMRQRVMIAMAIASKPALLIADEPTTALDATVQVQILTLLLALQRTLGLSILFITHDLLLVRRLAHRVAVMYAGRLVELGAVEMIFTTPAHPYTMALLACRPVHLQRSRVHAGIQGQSPDLGHLPTGCAFHPRCPVAEPRCAQRVPSFDAVQPTHWVRCVKPFSKPVK